MVSTLREFEVRCLLVRIEMRSRMVVVLHNKTVCVVCTNIGMYYFHVGEVLIW